MSGAFRLLAALRLAEDLDYLRREGFTHSVEDVVAGRFVPTGRIRIAALRKGEWLGVDADAAEVEWPRLHPEDRVKVLS